MQRDELETVLAALVPRDFPGHDDMDRLWQALQPVDSEKQAT
jgi:hypothetical protein